MEQGRRQTDTLCIEAYRAVLASSHDRLASTSDAIAAHESSPSAPPRRDHARRGLMNHLIKGRCGMGAYLTAEP
jgi:hypothetical protein